MSRQMFGILFRIKGAGGGGGLGRSGPNIEFILSLSWITPWPPLCHYFIYYLEWSLLASHSLIWCSVQMDKTTWTGWLIKLNAVPRPVQRLRLSVLGWRSADVQWTSFSCSKTYFIFHLLSHLVIRFMYIQGFDPHPPADMCAKISFSTSPLVWGSK